MIEIIDIGIEDAIAYRLENKISKDEMTSLLSLFKEKIDQGKKLIVYQEIVSIGGAEFEALLEKLKFFKKVGLSHFKRVAVVTHKKWIHKIVDIEGKLFTHLDMKGFPLEAKEAAIEFLEKD